MSFAAISALTPSPPARVVGRSFARKGRPHAYFRQQLDPTPPLRLGSRRGSLIRNTDTSSISRLPTRRSRFCQLSSLLEASILSPWGLLFKQLLYKLQARIEQTMGNLQRFKRIAVRCDKTKASFPAMASFARSIMLIKPVHTTQRLKTAINWFQST